MFTPNVVFLFIRNEIWKSILFFSLTPKTLTFQLSVYTYRSFRIKQVPLILFVIFYFLKFCPIWYNVSSDIICIQFLFSRHFTLIERWIFIDTVSSMTSCMIYFLFYEVWPFLFFIFVSRKNMPLHVAHFIFRPKPHFYYFDLYFYLFICMC